MEPKAGRQRIALRLSEWNNLKESITQLHVAMPDLPDESPFDTGKDTCDYDAMTTHAFKQPEPVECYCDAMNHHANPYNSDPMYMKKMKSTNMLI